MPGPGIRVGDAVLLRNNRLSDRKGGNFAFKWLGPYFVTSVSTKGVAMLKNRDGKILLKKYNIAQLKPYVDCEGSKSVGEDSGEISQIKVNAEENEHEEEKPNGDISDKTVDEDVTENSLNFWDMLPDEIIEKIILDAIKRSAHKCQTYEYSAHLLKISTISGKRETASSSNIYSTR